MSAFLLVVPWLLVRHAIPLLSGGDGSSRAAHVALGEKDAAARAAYDLLTLAVVLLPLTLSVRAEGATLWAGAGLYALGLALEVKATWDFCHPGSHGFCEGGLYRFSRNPMYATYLLVLLGVSVLAESAAMLLATIAFQLAGHRLVLAEEAWCRARFGEPYASYARRVRRYL